MNKLFRILIIYFIILNLLFGNSQTKEVRAFKTLKNPRIFEQLLSEDYSKWEKEKNNVSPNLVSEKRGRRVLGSAYSLRSDLTGGMLDSNGNINIFKDGNLTATAGVSRQKGESEAVYYSNNEDITKGKTIYNNNPEVKVVGVDVKTKEIEGSVKSLDIISVQDSVNGKSRGYSVNVGIGFGKHTNGEKVVNGPYISSVGAGYSKSDTTQKITRNVAEFSAESGILEVKDKVRQVGSLIDGGFTLNAKKYEHEDLEDINKSKSIGINVTVYPNVTYTVRDGKGKGIYTDGHTINGSGAVYKVGVSYAEVDKNREVVSTIGSNVKISQDMGDINRDVNNQVKEFEGKEVRGINVDLGTEYWLTEAGRGKTRDIIEGAGRTVKSIKKILTKTDSNGELEIVKNMEAESALRKMEQRGFVEGKDKKIERVAKEIETKYGNLTKKGIKVRFYGEEDVDTSGLTEAQLRKLKADGIATTGDGYIWINKEKIKDGNTINFNKVVSHEITHQILGEDSEYEARYVESGMEEFLSEIKGNGYLKDGKIIDLLYSRLTDEDRARLNRYILEDMQFKDMIGVDFRYEDKFNVNISKQNKLASEKELRKISKYEEVEKAALEAKRRGKKDKEIEKIYERGIDKIKEEEKYNKDRIINGKEKEFYEYVMKNSNLYTYRIETLAGNNGYYLVNESIGNEEMVPTEMPDSKVTLNEFRRNVLNGNIVYSVGILTTGYGITKEEAKRNREIKNGMLLNGLLQTGEGAVKATTGVSAIAGGATGCYYSGGMGCGIGLQMIGSGIVVGGMGINETYVGLQNIGYALSSGSGIRKGTAIEEYNRIRKEKGYIPANNVKINNPVLNYIVNKGGDERDYQVINAVTGAMATELNIYNNYYKKTV